MRSIRSEDASPPVTFTVPAATFQLNHTHKKKPFTNKKRRHSCFRNLLTAHLTRQSLLSPVCSDKSIKPTGMLNIFGRQDRYEAVVEFDQAASQPSVHYTAFQQQHTLPVSTPQPEEKYYWLARQEPASTLGLPSPACHTCMYSRPHTHTHIMGLSRFLSLSLSRFLPACTGRDGREVENMKRLENPGQMWADRVGEMEVDWEQRVWVRISKI